MINEILRNYLTKFSTTSEYEAAGGQLDFPNVSLIDDTGDVYYKLVPEITDIFYDSEYDKKISANTVESITISNALKKISGNFYTISFNYDDINIFDNMPENIFIYNVFYAYPRNAIDINLIIKDIYSRDGYDLYPNSIFINESGRLDWNDNIWAMKKGTTWMYNNFSDRNIGLTIGVQSNNNILATLFCNISSNAGGSGGGANE